MSDNRNGNGFWSWFGDKLFGHPDLNISEKERAEERYRDIVARQIRVEKEVEIWLRSISA